MLYNQLEDTTAMYRGGLECLKYFPNEPLPYVMISLPLLILERFRASKRIFRTRTCLVSG